MARIVSAGNGSQFHSGEWAYATNRNLGLKFSIQGETHHGWARLSVYVVKGRPYVRSTLTGYAYETIAGRGFTGAELALDARPWNYATKCSGWRWSGPPMAVGALRRSCAVAACRSIANECSGGCGKTTCCACGNVVCSDHRLRSRDESASEPGSGAGGERHQPALAGGHHLHPAAGRVRVLGRGAGRVFAVRAAQP